MGISEKLPVDLNIRNAQSRCHQNENLKVTKVHGNSVCSNLRESELVNTIQRSCRYPTSFRFFAYEVICSKEKCLGA